MVISAADLLHLLFPQGRIELNVASVLRAVLFLMIALAGFADALTLQNLLFVWAGIIIGQLVGGVPGIGPAKLHFYEVLGSGQFRVCVYTKARRLAQYG